MNRQEMFETALKGLLEQEAFSTNDYGTCMYRDGKGNACAIGLLITDDEYDAIFNGRSELSWEYSPILWDIVKFKKWDRDHEFLRDMQKLLHDGPVTATDGVWNKDRVLKGARLFARKFGLEMKDAF